MKRTAFAFALLCASLLATKVDAQKIKLVEGDLSALRGQTSINIQFVYEDITIGKDQIKEADYVNRKKSEYNAKTPGKGDTWAQEWVDDRKNRFEPRFSESVSKESGMSVSNEAKYTLIFKTHYLEPGFKSPMGFGNRNAEMSGEAWIIESADPSHVVAKLTVTNAPGRLAFGFDYDTGVRLQESYATAGKQLARFIKKA